MQATAHWLLGRIARASDPALARHCLDTAEMMAARLGCQPLVAHCMAERAWGAAGSGRTDEVMRLRRQAEQRYRALGMGFWLQRMTQQW